MLTLSTYTYSSIQPVHIKAHKLEIYKYTWYSVRGPLGYFGGCQDTDTQEGPAGSSTSSVGATWGPKKSRKF